MSASVPRPAGTPRTPPRIAVLGIFVADATFRGARLPRMGETVLGSGFALGPGGKGSNQAVAAGRAGAKATIVTRLGDDDFADLAEATWREASVEGAARRDPDSHTGAAMIFVDERTGDNAIVVSPGAAGDMSERDVERHRAAIEGARVFLVQLEQPLPAARRALEIARAANVTTILNPAPAAPLDDALLALCDWVTPNETEAEALTGIAVESIEDAVRAADALLARGARGVVVTLGERGALLHDGDAAHHVEAVFAGPVRETTGAGDSFNGAFAVGLAEGMASEAAARFACAAAAISVTRPGAAAAMPMRAEIVALLERTG